MAELTGDTLRHELRQVVQETLCQELAEVATRVHRAVKEEIQAFVDRWFSEDDARAPKRCDGHLAEPLKALGQRQSQTLSVSSHQGLIATLPLVPGIAESSSVNPKMDDDTTHVEESSTKREDCGRCAERASSGGRLASVQSEILPKISVEASLSSSSSETPQPNLLICKDPPKNDRVGSSPPRLVLQEGESDDNDKRNRKISFSDDCLAQHDESGNISPKRRGNKKRINACGSIDESKTQYHCTSKVVPAPDAIKGGETRKHGLKSSWMSSDSSSAMLYGQQSWVEEDSEEDSFSGSSTLGEGHSQWVMGIQKTITHATTVIVERERCHPPGWWVKIVSSAWFDYAATLFVILNAIIIGIEADWSVRNLHGDPPDIFKLAERFFCVVFTVELLMRISIHGIWFFSVPGWKWNIFDTIIVTLQLVEEGVNIANSMDEEGESGSSIGTSNFNLVRILRILRLLRVFRIVRIVRFVSELRTMVASIAGALRSLFWTVILIFLMIYVVGVYLTQLVSDHGAENPDDMRAESPLRMHYGSLTRSILSLFQAMTGGVDWEDLVNPLMEEITPLLGLLFTVYIAFAVLAMMNVVTAVFIETALQNANKDKDTDTQTMIRKFISSDENCEDDIIEETMTWEDFKQRLRNPTKKGYFRALDMDIAEAKGLFQLLDTEGDGRIQVEEFVSWFLQLRGPAKAIDLATVMYQHKRLAVDWAKHVSFVEETLADILSSMPGSKHIAPQTPIDAKSLLKRQQSFGSLSNIRNSKLARRNSVAGTSSSNRWSGRSARESKQSGAGSSTPLKTNLYSVMADAGAASQDDPQAPPTSQTDLVQ